MPLDLSARDLSFRIAGAAFVLWLLSMWSEPFHAVIGLGLMLAGIALAVRAFARRQEPVSKRRRTLLNAAILAVAGLLLWTGVVAIMSTPLLVLAAVCAALGVIALLGSPNDPDMD